MKYDFFRLNMPFGLLKRRDGKWVAFNSAHAPIGAILAWPETEVTHEEGSAAQFVTFYTLSEKKILDIVGEKSVTRDGDGHIDRFYLYDERALPTKTGKAWQHYISKLLQLSKLSA